MTDKEKISSMFAEIEGINKNVQQAIERLAEKGEPFLIFFQNGEGNLQMAVHGMCLDHAKDTLKVALEGMEKVQFISPRSPGLDS